MEMLLVGLIFVAGFGAGCAVYGLMRHLQDLERELIDLRARAGKRPSNFLIAGTEDVTATLTEAMREVETLEHARDFWELRLAQLDRSLRRAHELVTEVRNGTYDKEQPARR
jgi:hypothetical protein